MSADHLPEDLRRWPQDPYQVLGLTAGCDPKQARKAYTRLIRQFKPEQFPEHFRRIREAYEAIERYGKYFGFMQPPSAEGAPISTDEADAGQDMAPQSAGADEQTHWPEPLARSAPADLEEIWDQACDGQEQETYQAFREKYNGNPRDGELLVRLYWLLVANPALDPVRSPCDWLIRGLLDQGAWGPCRELYRREVEDNPSEALSERYWNVLESTSQPQILADLVAWRWQAASRLGRPEIIASDLEPLGARLANQNEDLWLNLLVVATDHLAWARQAPDRMIFENLCKEIESRANLDVRLSETLTRLDFLLEVANAWRLLVREQRAPKAFLALIPLSWSRPIYEIRSHFLSYLRDCARDPFASLEFFDRMQEEAAPVLAQFGQTLIWLSATTADHPKPDAMQSAIAAFLGAVQPTDYSYYRQHLLRFCIAEAVAPDMVADAMDQGGRFYLISQAIRADWPLRHVCMAQRLVTC